MKHVKRVELIVDQEDAAMVIEELGRIGINHYTLIEGIGGKGDHGIRGHDPFSGAFDNCYILIACDVDEVGPLVEMIRPVLHARGGVALVSDAQWVIH